MKTTLTKQIIIADTGFVLERLPENMPSDNEYDHVLDHMLSLTPTFKLEPNGFDDQF